MNYLDEEWGATEYKGDSPTGKRRRPPPVSRYLHFAYEVCGNG